MSAATESSARDSDSDLGGSPAPAGLPPSPTASRVVIGCIGAVVIIGIAFRFITRSELWLDEALSVNIARLPLGELDDALRVDGAPPLYYVLLHFWIRLFGHGNFAVRSLSGVISVAALPLAFVAGRRIGGRAVGWLTVIVLASSPFAIRFGTETRMYALVMLLVLGGYLAVQWAMELPSWPRLALVAVVTASLMYSQYWSLYLIPVVAIVLAVAARRATAGSDRQRFVRVLLAMGVGLVGFLPWISNFRYQLAHTGTPWGDPRLPWSAIQDAWFDFAGATGIDHGERSVLVALLLVLALLGLFGRALDRRRIEIDLHTRPQVRWESVVAFGTLILGLTLSWLNGAAFQSRYAAVMYPLVVLIVAFGLTVFSDRRVLALVVALVVGLGLVGGVRNVVDERTQAVQTAAVIRAEAKPGDVVAYCPDQLGPDGSRLLEGGPHLKQITFPGSRSPRLIDWVDYIEQVQKSDPGAFAQDAVRRAGPNHTVWYVLSEGYRNVEGKCEAIEAALQQTRSPVVRVESDGTKYFEYQGLIEYRPQ